MQNKLHLKPGFVLEECLRSFQNMCFNCHNFADKRGNSYYRCCGKNHKEFKGCNSANEHFNLEEKCRGKMREEKYKRRRRAEGG